MMCGVRLLLLFLQLSLLPTAQAASPSLPLQRNPITLGEPTNAAIANNRSELLTNLGNGIRLFFTNLGDPIPAAEVRHTLTVANADVQAHLPHHAYERIPRDLFETNTTFPETGDNIYFWVYSYGYGLSWLQLSQALGELQNYMLGIGPDHPPPHCQELEFYVQVTWLDVARGVVEFTPGARRAAAKRNLVTTTLQLTQANISSPGSNADVPIMFHVAPGLDINVTTLGLPIPEPVVLTALEKAWLDVILDHTDIDATVPRNKFPYSFNHTSGKRPHLFDTEITISQYPGKKMYWGLLCLLYTGVRDFMVSTRHFNVLRFEILDARLGKLGFGTVQYYPTPSNVLLSSE